MANFIEGIINLTKGLYEILPNQRALIKGMLLFDDLNSDGWQDTREIMRKGNFGAQINNVRNYLLDLIKKGIVEERNFEYQDKRKRTFRKKQFRLSPTIETYNTLKIWKDFFDYKLPKLDNFIHILYNKIGKVEMDSVLMEEKAIQLESLKEGEQELKEQLSQIQDQIKKLNGGVKK